MEREDIKEEEYRILEDEEDRRMRRIEKALKQIVERAEKEEKREKELGPLCGVISDIQFIKDDMGNHAMFFQQPTPNYSVSLEVEKTVVYANQDGKLDKDFSYPSFQGIMMVHLLSKGARSYSIDNMVDVYRFLKSDIENNLHNKPNIDLLFRVNKKTQNVNVYADVKLGKTAIKESVSFNHLPTYCKALNDTIQKGDREESKRDKSFGDDEK